MLNIVIFGAPGSGKGTQSERITDQYGLKHISTGDMLRLEIKSGSPLGIIAKKHIDQGQLVPDQLITDMLSKLLKGLGAINGVILDGFPRTVEQAEALKEIFADMGQEVSVMLNLEVDKEELIKRLLIRGETSGRSDDNLETIKKRIAVYDEVTSSVIEFYKNEGLYKSIEGTGSIDQIFGRICKAVDSVAGEQAKA
jgi:adenylate kinase